MKTFINRTAFSMVVAALAVTGCTKAKTNRMAELKARAVAAAPVVSIVAPVEAAPVEPTPAPAPVAEVPAKRVRNASIPPWQQLVPDMTKAEVESFVGKPNAMSERKWVYKSGGTVRFSDSGLLSSYEVPRR